MRVLFAFLFYFSFLFAQLSANEIQGELELNSSASFLKEGDLVEGLLKIWPLENADLSQIRKLEKTLFFDSLYLAKINSLAPSDNNADVIELKGHFFVKNSKNSELYFIKYNDLNIPVRINQLNLEELGEKQESYFIADQNVEKDYWLKIAIISLLLVILILVIFRKKIRQWYDIKTQKDILQKKKYFDELFRVANDRKDFEEIYLKRNKWIPLLSQELQAHQEFFNVLNNHQFKKEWLNEEYLEVRTSFDYIRRSFEK